MHDASVVVGNAVVVDGVGRVLLEVELSAWLNVAKVDDDETVAIRSRLLVLESHRVTNLVHDHAFLQLQDECIGTILLRVPLKT